MSVPDDRLYDAANDLWVKREGDEVVIGPTRRGIEHAGDIFALTPKVPGTEVDFDRGLAVIEVAKTIVALHSPLSLVVTARNEEAMRKPSLLASDPYGAGWIVRARPLRWDQESPRLVDAACYESATP